MRTLKGLICLIGLAVGTLTVWGDFNMPHVRANFKDTRLSEVLSAMAGIGALNFSIDHASIPDRKIDFFWNGDPIEGVLRLAADNGVTITKKEGCWYFGKNNDRMLRQYALRYTHLEPLKDILLEEDKVTEKDKDGKALLDPNLPKPNQRFEFLKSELIKLDDKGNVSYDSSTNTVVANATENAQTWIESYIKTIDQEMPNIELKVMFLASSEDPQTQFGFDWSDSFKDGFGMNISANEKDFKGIRLNGLNSSILSTDALTTKLRLFESRSDVNTKRYPSVTTSPGQAVVIDFTCNEPVVTTSSSTQVETSTTSIGKGTTSTVDVKQEKIGTQIFILPVLMGGNRIFLDTQIKVSNIVGYKTVRGDAYPLISRTHYNGRSSVDSGHTLVVGGLEEMVSENTKRGLKGLRNIPVLGWLFEDSKKSANTKKLSLYISVRLLDTTGKEFGQSGVLDKEVQEFEKRIDSRVEEVRKALTAKN